MKNEEVGAPTSSFFIPLFLISHFFPAGVRVFTNLHAHPVLNFNLFPLSTLRNFKWIAYSCSFKYELL